MAEAGRPRTHGDRISTAVRFTPETHQRLSEEAKTRDVSASWLVNRAVEEFLEHLIPVDEILRTRRRIEKVDSEGDR